MWAEEVNRQLTEARRPERVDHRSLAAQREEAVQQPNGTGIGGTILAALSEQDQWDPDAKTWRETRKTVEWETNQVAKAAAAVAEWHRRHPVQSLAIRAGLKKVPADLERLEQTQGKAVGSWRPASDGSPG